MSPHLLSGKDPPTYSYYIHSYIDKEKQSKLLPKDWNNPCDLKAKETLQKKLQKIKDVRTDIATTKPTGENT